VPGLCMEGISVDFGECSGRRKARGIQWFIEVDSCHDVELKEITVGGLQVWGQGNCHVGHIQDGVVRGRAFCCGNGYGSSISSAHMIQSMSSQSCLDIIVRLQRA